MIEKSGIKKEPLDLTFIVNEPGKTLKGRFEELIWRD